MTNTLPKLSIRPDLPVEPRLLDILRRVDAVARGQGIDYFVGGALARDLILLHVFGKDTGRATRDVDLGICIDDWSRLDSLKGMLVQGGGFAEQPRIAHRLIYRLAEDAFGIPLDLLPFGGIENADGAIAWPPGMEIVMNVAGFAEACASALMVEVAEDLIVPVTSLPSLAVLKLIAWRDRHPETPKDATDFLLIARYYADAGNYDRLYETESALLQAVDFDPELAGAMLLGKDAAVVCSASTEKTVSNILTDAYLKQRLIDQLLRTTLSSGENSITSRVEQFVGAFLNGFRDAFTRTQTSQ
ncbi:MAG: nucleotidyl transferase AbiEii/AbiGii toxin family protein [Betaproteobacteria bacterium]|nr:nucleotidyl transferase AbiEii/AbiGii toxin family protein [Betaproteobacteria bacterium]